MKKLHVEMTIREAYLNNWVFSYKKRLWTATAYLPRLEAYEIWSWTGEQCRVCSPDTRIIGRFRKPF